LIELLVVIGIIGILIAFLMPALAGARRAALTTQCASNIRQLLAAMTNYSVEFKGNYPGNVGATNTYWYNRYAIGRYIKSPYEQSNSEQCIGSVFVCPADLDDSTGKPVRSYSMNVYASGFVSPFVEQALNRENPVGKLWKSSVSGSSNMILLIESFSCDDWPAEDQAVSPGTGATGQWSSPALVGFVGRYPADRFVSGGYDVPARFGQCQSQLCYFRHRQAKETYGLGVAIGRLNIGFADGHVSLFSNTDLVDKEGKSTYAAMWSPIDREIDQQH
jgi:prepilin-type processing-associated H-X9-DG protein